MKHTDWHEKMIAECVHPYGLCQCGCGQPAPISKYTSLKWGLRKGQPARYIKGHVWKQNQCPLLWSRTCSACLIEKPRSEFSPIKRSPGIRSTCHECDYRLFKQWAEKNVEKRRQTKRVCHLRKEYDCSPERYAQELEKQNGLCAICLSPEQKRRKDGSLIPLSVDHNHRTKEIRGLLCKDCNSALGLFKDDPLRTQQATIYLQNSEG